MTSTRRLYLVLALVGLVAGGIASAIGLNLAHLPPSLIPAMIVVMLVCLGISAARAVRAEGVSRFADSGAEWACDSRGASVADELDTTREYDPAERVTFHVEFEPQLSVFAKLGL